VAGRDLLDERQRGRAAVDDRHLAGLEEAHGAARAVASLALARLALALGIGRRDAERGTAPPCTRWSRPGSVRNYARR
jgi:hypothetical protein